MRHRWCAITHRQVGAPLRAGPSYGLPEQAPRTSPEEGSLFDVDTGSLFHADRQAPLSVKMVSAKQTMQSIVIAQTLTTIGSQA